MQNRTFFNAVAKIAKLQIIWSRVIISAIVIFLLCIPFFMHFRNWIILLVPICLFSTMLGFVFICKLIALGLSNSKSIDGDETNPSSKGLEIVFYGTERQETIGVLKKKALANLLEASSPADYEEFDDVESFLSQGLSRIEDLLNDHDIANEFNTSETETYSIINRVEVRDNGIVVFSDESYYCNMDPALQKNGKYIKNFCIKPIEKCIICAEETIGKAYYNFALPAETFDKKLLKLNPKNFCLSTYDGEELELLDSENSCDDSDGCTVYDKKDFADISKKYWKKSKNPG